MLEIVSAFYGDKDVKDIIIPMIENDRLFLNANNSLFGDPNVGVTKYLNIEYVYNDEKKHIQIKENKDLFLPEVVVKKEMSKIEEIFKSFSIAFNPNDEQYELASMRIEICNACEFKNNSVPGISRCSVCGCALKGKIYTPKTYLDEGGSCPKEKWKPVEQEWIDKNKK